MLVTSTSLILDSASDRKQNPANLELTDKAITSQAPMMLARMHARSHLAVAGMSGLVPLTSQWLV